MNFKPVKRIPALIAFVVIVLVCAVRLLRIEFFERLERMTYDMRARQALRFSAPIATNLGFISIDESSIDFVRTNVELGYRAGLYWPRHIYGRLASELAAQGARAVAFDVIFGELRPDHGLVLMADNSTLPSDDFFAMQIQRASNVIIAAAADKMPPPLFLTNAMALGDISTEKDRPEGILRRTRAFRAYRKWHPLFEKAESEYGFDLSKAHIERFKIVLARADKEKVEAPLDVDGNFSVADFIGDKLPAGMPARARPYTDEKVWNMGIVLAARELKLDLANANIDLPHGRIILSGPGGIQRVIPTDAEGFFYIDWAMPANHPRLTQEPIQQLLLQNRNRLGAQNGETNNAGSPIQNLWRDKLVIVGSSALGNDLTDRGATPLGEDTLLVSKHWNVANSILTGRFVRRTPLGVELALIILLGSISAFFTWHSRVLLASGLVLVLAAVYAVLGLLIFVQTRYWIPLVLPVTGGLFMNYVCLVAWRVKFEQAEVRRVKSIFAKVVSPKIMKELLHAESLSLVGAPREVSVLFTDIRGFTEFTDMAQEQTVELIQKYGLKGEAAETFRGEQAREVLATVNLYLGVVADVIIKCDGTLDKFIGDCVMAFWGAPTPNPNHAVSCVRAAIEAQRAIHALNEQRATDNKKRELENRARISAGLKPFPVLPLLLLGSGINSGIATAGLMGSKAEQKNYTVFGSEVNLASRIEALSGHARIFISQSTYEHLVREDPTLSALCRPQPPQKVKGIGTAIRLYEVSWRPAEASVPESSAAKELSEDEQMALYEKELKENDWGHQPC